MDRASLSIIWLGITAIFVQNISSSTDILIPAIIYILGFIAYIIKSK